MREGILTLGLVLVALGCGPGRAPEAAAPEAAAPEAAAPEAVASDRLTLQVFDCGRLRFASIEGFSVSDEESPVRELSVPCYVIEHPDGRLLWEGGLPSSVAEVDGWHGEGMEQRLDRTFAEQLQPLGLDLSSFDYMAFSHTHFDHIGVADEVRGAVWLIQRAEFDAATSEEPQSFGFDPALYDQARELEVQILDGDHDVFGDGRVRLLSTPGHTPGHQMLLVDLAETGPVLLSGDLYILEFARQHRRVPTFNFDADATVESMDRIERLVEETGATLWVEHELALFETLRKAPEVYD